MKGSRDQNADRFKINEPGVYIYGQHTAIIDGKAEIYEYSDKEIVFSLSSKNKFLTVYGRALTVRVAGRCVSEVSGHIDGVKYGGGDAKC